MFTAPKLEDGILPAPLTLFDTPDELAFAVAARIADGLQAAAPDGRVFRLAAPSGRTPTRAFAALAQLVRDRGLPLDRLSVTMLDEYAEQAGDGAFRSIDPDAAHSCARWARRHIVEGLNAASDGPFLRADAVRMPDAADPAAFEAELRASGGFDLMILATGTSDGHVAFNPPGTPVDAGVRVIPLAEETREDNLKTFPSLTVLDDVPRFGVTMGPATMRDLAAQTIMVISGVEKAPAAGRILEASAYDPAWPSTIIHECREPMIMADSEALSLHASSRP